MLCDTVDLDALGWDPSFLATGEDVRLEGALLDCLRAFLVPSSCGELVQLLEGLWSWLLLSLSTLPPTSDTGGSLELSEEPFLDATLSFWSTFCPLPASDEVFFCPCSFFLTDDDGLGQGLGNWLASWLTTSCVSSWEKPRDTCCSKVGLFSQGEAVRLAGL